MASKKKPHIKKRVRRKKNILLCFIRLLVLFLALTFALAYLSLYGLSHWNLLTIKEIEIKGTQFLNDSKLYQQLAVFRERNIFSVKDAEIENALSDFPRIKFLKVIRKLPHTVKISVQERVPIAILRCTDGSRYLIDSQGVALDYASDFSQYSLPIFSKINIKNLTLGNQISDSSTKILLSVYQEIKKINPDFLKHISEFLVQDSEVILTEKEHGTRFILGKEKFAERINKLIFAYQNFGVANFSEIDLRYSDSKNELIILR
jgi:cell division septal protein FtsQ